MIDLKRGIVVQYYWGDPLEHKPMVVSEVFYEDSDVLEWNNLRLTPTPQDNLPDVLPARVPYSSEPKAEHWTWAKKWSTNA